MFFVLVILDFFLMCCLLVNFVYKYILVRVVGKIWFWIVKIFELVVIVCFKFFVILFIVVRNKLLKLCFIKLLLVLKWYWNNLVNNFFLLVKAVK